MVQSIPAGLLVTVPVPVPLKSTDSDTFVGIVVDGWMGAVKTAVQLLLVSTVTLPVLLQSPDQLENVEPLSGVAVKLTVAAAVYVSLQSVPQLIPAGLEVTVPVPLPVLLTVSVTGATGFKVKLAVHVRLFMYNKTVLLLAHAPDQPANEEVASAIGVKAYD